LSTCERTGDNNQEQLTTYWDWLMGRYRSVYYYYYFLF